MDTEQAFNAYVECALWASTDDDGDPLDGLGLEIDEGSLAEMRADVEAFMSDPDLAADLALWTDEQAGHDFWLTRNGHGAGFWDRGKGAAGDRLSKAAHVYGESYLYVGDDGLVYVG